jgi:hypothetical protein
MSIHASAGPANEWVPLTDEIFDSLYDQYCTWLSMAPEERAHMVALKRYEDEVAALALTNPPEHQAWQQAIGEWETLYAQLDVELGDRRREGRPALSDDQKSRVDAAQKKMAGTYAAWLAICPRKPEVVWAPEICIRLEQIKKQIANLHAIEAEWRKHTKFTPEEQACWFHIAGGCASSPRSFDQTEYAIAHLGAKLLREYRGGQAFRRDSMGMRPRLGLNLLGKKFKKVRR